MVKIVAVAIICALIILYLKSIDSELTAVATIGSGIILIGFSLSYVEQAFLIMERITELTGLDEQTYKILFKISAIGYLVEFGAGTIEDFGLKSLADKLVFAGKAVILCVSLPVIYAVINVISSLVQ